MIPLDPDFRNRLSEQMSNSPKRTHDLKSNIPVSVYFYWNKTKSASLKDAPSSGLIRITVYDK